MVWGAQQDWETPDERNMKGMKACLLKPSLALSKPVNASSQIDSLPPRESAENLSWACKCGFWQECGAEWGCFTELSNWCVPLQMWLMCVTLQTGWSKRAQGRDHASSGNTWPCTAGLPLGCRLIRAAEFFWAAKCVSTQRKRIIVTI